MRADNIQASELALNFRCRIQELHQKSAAIDEKIRTALTEKLETTNEAAQLIYAARKDLNSADFDAATDFLDHDALASYLALGRKYRVTTPEPETDISKSLKTVRDAMMLTGGISRPSGHGPQQLHAPNFVSTFSKGIMNLTSEWSKQLARNPIEAWAYPTLEQFVHQVQPWVEKVNGIYKRAKDQLEAL